MKIHKTVRNNIPIFIKMLGNYRTTVINKNINCYKNTKILHRILTLRNLY